MVIDDTLEQHIRAEFIDEARDITNEIDVMLGNVRSSSIPQSEAIQVMRRHFHNLRIGARSVGLMAAGVILHQMADYIDGVDEIGDHELDGLQAFTDLLRGALNTVQDEAAAPSLREVVRQLPTVRTFDVSDIKLLDIVILLVSPQRSAGRIVERELMACGYRVVNVSKSFEALEMTVRLKPDLVIASAMLDELTGIDLACAIMAMPITQDIPFALLTSFGWGDPSLDGLPTRAAIIRKGSYFGDDLAEALSRFSIT
jgi:PleD family two-component response regulator